MNEITNNPDELSKTEQLAILKATYYFIEATNNTFTFIRLYLPDRTIIWKCVKIDEAIVYCKKNNIQQINDLPFL